MKTKQGTVENSTAKSADNVTVDSCTDSGKAEFVIYAKAWSKTKPPNDADVSSDNPSLNCTLTPTHDVVLNTKSVTAAKRALPDSAQDV